MPVKTKSQDQYLKEIIKKHGDKYDYSLVKYTGYKNKIKIICKIHGEFLQLPSSHLSGQGCSKCNKYIRKITKDQYFDKVFKVHGNKYDYSLANYINGNSKIKIICGIHGIFEQRASGHAFGAGCLKCSRKVNISKTHKQCSNCRLYKEKVEFGVLNKSKDKLSYSCKQCLYNRINKWSQDNIIDVRKTKDKWKKSNKESTNAYARNKRKIDKNYQLKTNMRGRLSSSFKKFKTNSSIRYLDYSIQELKDHLESKFTKGMTWGNYGKNGWEIDHIIPIACFNINGDSKCEDFKLCWSLSNLQPLWKTNKIAMIYGESESYIGNCQKQNKLFKSARL